MLNIDDEHAMMKRSMDSTRLTTTAWKQANGSVVLRGEHRSLDVFPILMLSSSNGDDIIHHSLGQPNVV